MSPKPSTAGLGEQPADRPKARRAESAPVSGSVWTRPPRPTRRRLSLETIVRTAIDLADAHGLDAITIRRVAAELNARPMSLYSFMDRKDDLIELMVDEILGEMVLDELPQDWLAALHAIAAQTRAVGHRHPWLVAAIMQRPALGPNAVRHADQSMTAIAGLGLEREQARTLLIAVDAFTMGFGGLELAGRSMRQRDGLSESEWADSTGAYLDGLSRAGRTPHLAQLAEAPADDAFAASLNWLLSGFAASLGTPADRAHP
ncbi:TetR/AcrR family transcriptional regulator C-terminal domain-containing protein [Plantactinospora sp. KBS50]|uniref:TetR/AcrR family transcriptional regulator C-terminal domain-containing protein n=1 Tax=Plantactinospora sp. KBS50 TaxID=2024580 RepID=UPI0012FD06E9|nr:TetR/AcrR family transcriptional regulator C-terminal domain-containing protein [Plantactinospora sp. KBS50]